MRTARLLPLLLGSTLSLACGNDTPDGYYGTVGRHGRPPTAFYLNNHDEPEYLDPGLISEQVGSTLALDLFEGLVVRHPEDLRPVQGMAARYDKSDDNRHYRFHLRPQARWSDGKAVVASDFVYAWRRVLDPKTGARMVTQLYPLKNAELFHQGKLKVLSRPEILRPARAAKDFSPGDVGQKLPAGKALRILMTTPLRVGFAPLPRADAKLTFEHQAAKGGKPALLSTAGATKSKLAGGSPQPAQLLAVGPKTRCNDQVDRYYEVQRGKQRGWLPGCALIQERNKAAHALVQVHHDTPRFRPAPADAAPPGGATVQLGFVPLSTLRSDPAVVGVRAVGEKVLEVELEQPTPYFLDLLGYPTYFPVRRDLIERLEAAGKHDQWTRPEHIIVNGPYTLSEHKFRYEMTFVRNPHHYAFDRLKLHRIVWLAVGDYHATMALYKTGEIDYIGATLSLPSAYMKRLARYRDFHTGLWLGTYWYEFNVDKVPVNDKRVRHALNLATDKKQLVEKVTRAGQVPATHVVPDFTGFGYAEAAASDKAAGRDPFAGPDRIFNPERGRQLLREAGYPVEKNAAGRWVCKKLPPLEILYNTSEGHRSIAVAIQDMWKRHLGISVSLRNEEWKVMLKNLRDGHFQVARFGWVADYNHPHTFLDLFLSHSQNNWTRYADPKLDALVKRAAATADPVASIQLYRQAEAMVMEAMPRLPLYFYTKSTLIKPYVKGYWPNVANEHPVRFMWVDPRWRSNSKNVAAYPPEELPSPGRIAPP